MQWSVATELRANINGEHTFDDRDVVVNMGAHRAIIVNL
jgi:hypothetical protein